ncbi:MAG: hypothetical protein J3Q66DRAFT_394836 [Benniella sp.]|nr:MAG: hypothetical protein J3Q66DRAFT_394836 [Benniella sp.]
MAVKQLVLPFQIRNPYRLDRPHFDPSEVRQFVIEEEEVEEELCRLQSLPQRPLPPEPVVGKKSTALGRSSEGGAYTGVHPRRGSRNEIYEHRRMTKPKLNDVASPEPLQRTSAYSSHGQQPTLDPVPTIRVTHHIDTYSELTFERHVEWLTQTALWWDMPVVHLYPAPESSASLMTQFKTIKSRKRENNQAQETTGDPCHEGGMVRAESQKASVQGRRSLLATRMTGSSITGYVFVGSVEEQAQYHHVIETMEKLFPRIEIRYINSFEPTHLQSRQQQELKGEPCVHSLSWIYYWSAAKESQVMQSRIVNEVVRVRPMWINNDLLYRNYTPPVPPAATLPPADTLDCTLSLSACSISTSPSASIEIDENRILDVPSLADVNVRYKSDLFEEERNGNSDNGRCGYQASPRTFLGRTQSSLDVLQNSLHGYKLSSRRLKRWGIPSLTGEKKSSYRRSISTPMLVLTKEDDIIKGHGSNRKSIGTDSSQEENTGISSPPSSPATLASPTPTCSSVESIATLPETSLSGIGSRLAGFAQQLGVYKMKESPLIMVDY